MSTTDRYILLVEDDVDDQELLREVFHSIEPPVPELRFVNSGNQLLTYLEEVKDDRLPCLILLDYNMPGLNGAEILDEMSKSKRYAKLPKIIWSTSGTDSFKTTCLSLGALDYVIKPTTVEDLKAVAEYLLTHCLK